MRTILGQYEDNYDYNQVESSDLDDYDSTILGHDDKNLQCEKQIIQCQVTNDRLLGSTSKSLRKKYGNDIVNRAIMRLSKRKMRGKCSRKAELMKLEKIFKPVIETYFKKSDESFSKGAL
tara:strand:- start:98 stop:457 length:360 start_codon:yes stop_codon:yes gene_type:complete